MGLGVGKLRITGGEPLVRRDLGRKPHPWTVLVQGVNLHSDEADRLLRRFGFLPWARSCQMPFCLRGPRGALLAPWTSLGHPIVVSETANGP